MLKSMTGYGLANAEFRQRKITVEIRSLNSKFLELSLKMPRSHGEKESFIRNECSKLIERGKANVSISFEQALHDDVKQLNKERFISYYQQLQDLAINLKAENTDLFHETLKIPEVWNNEEVAADEEEWNAIYKTFLQAIDHFNQFRSEEGTTLAADLKKRIENIKNAIKEVEPFETQRIPSVREKLQQLLSEAVGQELVDQNRLEQELIYYIEKYDVTEEKLRLKTHCDYFIQVMQEKESNGKKLGFISQEIGREINTMGSKANDANIQKIVVGMKDELEKVKEQLLNII